MKIQKFFSRYKIFLFLLVLNISLIFISPALGKASLKVSFDNLLEMLTILPPIFIIMGLIDVWIPKQTMMKYLGKDSGIKGGLIAFTLGSFSAGPLYAAFPMAIMFLKKGASLLNVYIFIGAWSTTKIPMFMFEITQLGTKFALSRFVLNLIGIIVISLIIDKTTNDQKLEEITTKNIINDNTKI